VDVALAAAADVTAWRTGFVESLAARAGAGGAVGVHVKLDTGMGRLGTRDPAEADAVAEAVAAAPGLELAGAMTHFATADQPDDDGFFAGQLARFTPWARALQARHPGIVLHAANSAATLRDPAAHFDLVRCGVAAYGMDPFGEDPFARRLEPALELRSYVGDVKHCEPGDSAGYGRRFVAAEATDLAVLPIGYGDGVRRGLTNNADVLIAGVRHPLVGTVSMDNLTVDLGPDAAIGPGVEAVLIGADGDERITAEELARRLDTINYEITCGITARVPRANHRDGVPE
jgi:alanine racemase